MIIMSNMKIYVNTTDGISSQLKEQKTNLEQHVSDETLYHRQEGAETHSDIWKKC